MIFFDLRPLLLLPPIDGGIVPLSCPALRLLSTPCQRPTAATRRRRSTEPRNASRSPLRCDAASTAQSSILPPGRREGESSRGASSVASAIGTDVQELASGVGPSIRDVEMVGTTGSPNSARRRRPERPPAGSHPLKQPDSPAASTFELVGSSS
jgi:hypothetical protein